MPSLQELEPDPDQDQDPERTRGPISARCQELYLATAQVRDLVLCIDQIRRDLTLKLI